MYDLNIVLCSIVTHLNSLLKGKIGLQISSNMKQRSRAVQWPAILGFLAISAINIIIFLNPTKGYELSIYSSTPSVIWAFLLFSALCGIIIIILYLLRSNYSTSNVWCLGLILLLLSRISILYVPYNRGYFSWTGDNISHLGFVKDILVMGTFSSDNFYPITHLILSELTVVLNVKPELIVNYATALLSVFFVLSFYLLGKFLFPDKQYAILATTSIGCVFFNQYDLFLMPNGWSILFFPFSFYILYRAMIHQSPLSYKLLSIIILIFYPFFHPLSTLILILILGILTAISILSGYSKITSSVLSKIRLPSDLSPLWLLLILLGVWTPWLLSFDLFDNNVKLVVEAGVSGSSPNVMEGMAEKLEKMNFSIIDTIIIIGKEMGDDLVFYVLFFLGSMYATIKWKMKPEFHHLLVFIGVILLLGGLYASYIFNLIPGLDSVGGPRLAAYSIVFTPLFAAIVFVWMISKKNLFFVILCILLISAPMILSVFSLYPSPYVHRPSAQITSMDIHAMAWAIDNKDMAISFVGIMSTPNRFAEALLGVEKWNQRSDYQSYINIMPDHFNFPNALLVGQNFPEYTYLILNKLDRITYSTVYKPVGRFNDEDFIRIKGDSSVSYIYTNGESDIHLIKGIVAN